MIVLVSLFYSCSQDNLKATSDPDSNNWELVILDSIQVDYLGRVDGGGFRNGKGIFFNFQENKLIEFDTTGDISYVPSYPKDGPGKVKYPTQLRYTADERLFVASFMGWLYELNEDLSLKREIKFSFLSEAKNGGGLLRNLDHWNDSLISFYPGRDGANSYDPHFFRDHFLFGKIDPRTGGSRPIIKIPNTSRYSSDKYFERPWDQFGVSGDILYLTLSNEFMIHTFDLSK
ncbi:hypothetical protein [Belliella pelovolcani]|uniref:hypothetical protein n=1 Tax=Belliella pelovolcani TaxID=529505 RepID=UPI00391A9C54